MANLARNKFYRREVRVQRIRPVGQDGSLVVKGGLSEPGTVLSLLQLLLGLPELGQVEGGDLLGLLDLLLVGLHLKFIDVEH